MLLLLVRQVKEFIVRAGGLGLCQSHLVAPLVLPDEVVPQCNGEDDAESKADERGPEGGFIYRRFLCKEQLRRNNLAHAEGNVHHGSGSGLLGITGEVTGYKRHCERPDDSMSLHDVVRAEQAALV